MTMGSMGGPGRPSRDLEVVLRLEDLPSPGGGPWDMSFRQLVLGMTSFDLMVGAQQVKDMDLSLCSSTQLA